MLLLAETSENPKQISEINKDLDTMKNNVLNALHEIPYIENNCTTMVYTKDGKMFVEIIDGRTVDIMKPERAREEQKGLAKLYAIMNGETNNSILLISCSKVL